MEGRGACVRDDLYSKFGGVSYKDAIIVVASNKLPAKEAHARDNSFQNDIWSPICTRVKFVYTTVPHLSSEDFPYNTA